MTLAHLVSTLGRSLVPTGLRSGWLKSVAVGCAGFALLAGCETAPVPAPKPAPTTVAHPVATAKPADTPAETPAVPFSPADEEAGRLSAIVTIREGDVLKIAFPGAPKLDTTQQVRADGMVTIDILGEIKVTGQTAKELEKTLSQLFSSQLVSNEVSVTIVSSSFEVYVTGAVLRPGKITATKPITAFQAIMEAGYDPNNSNLEKVVLIREVARSKYTYIPLNLQLVLEGKETVPFYLKPSDTLQVPKKVSIFQ